MKAKDKKIKGKKTNKVKNVNPSPKTGEIKKDHYILPTEPELKKRDDYRLFADHSNKVHREMGLIDAQDGVVHHWSSVKVILGPDVIKSIDTLIEKWMEETPTESRTELQVETYNGKYSIGFEKYIVNFQYCANGCEQWVIVKCDLKGYPKIYSKHLGTFLLNGEKKLHFVHNQVFPISPTYMEYAKKETSVL
jgi:hypothetical protein